MGKGRKSETRSQINLFSSKQIYCCPDSRPVLLNWYPLRLSILHEKSPRLFSLLHEKIPCGDFSCGQGENLETYSFSTPVPFFVSFHSQKIITGFRVSTKSLPDFSPCPTQKIGLRRFAVGKGRISPPNFLSSSLKKILGARFATSATALVDRESVRVFPRKCSAFTLAHKTKNTFSGVLNFVGKGRLELPIREELVPKTSAYTNSATCPMNLFNR